jgi:hypothetical protein
LVGAILRSDENSRELDGRRVVAVGVFKQRAFSGTVGKAGSRWNLGGIGWKKRGASNLVARGRRRKE